MIKADLEPTKEEQLFSDRLVDLIATATCAKDALERLDVEPIPSNVELRIGKVLKWCAIAAVMHIDEDAKSSVDELIGLIKQKLVEVAVKEVSKNHPGKPLMVVLAGRMAPKHNN